MRSLFGFLVVAALVAGVAIGASAQEKRFSVGAKVWYAVPDFEADNAWLYGAVASMDINENIWVSGQYLYGKRKYDDGDEQSEQDAEGVLGTSFKFVDVGLGGRFLRFKIDDSINVYGPMAYVGAGTPIADLPIGWYATGAWMFYDFGNTPDDDKWEHFNLEGGLSYANDYIIATLGYRYKDYYHHSEFKEKGFTGSVSVRF